MFAHNPLIIRKFKQVSTTFGSCRMEKSNRRWNLNSIYNVLFVELGRHVIHFEKIQLSQKFSIIQNIRNGN